MKKNRFLALSLLACTLLAGCSNEEDTYVKNGSDPVGKTTEADKNDFNQDTYLSVQRLYEHLKSENAGSVALDSLVELIARIEYTTDYTKTTGVTIKSGLTGVRQYHTNDSFKKEIEEKFEAFVEGNTYNDEDGNFDSKKFKKSIEDTNNLTVSAGSSAYLSEKMNAKLGYNYDAYIEKDIIPSILKNYLYLDYLTGSSKYKGQFATQYGVNLEVLKINYDTSSENYSYYEALVRDLKALLNGSATDTYKFNTSMDMVTFNSNNDLIIVDAENSGITYDVYRNTGDNAASIDALVNTIYDEIDNAGTTKVEKVSFSDAKNAASSLTKDTDASFVINYQTKADAKLYEAVEALQIARSLWKIDREVVLARNYDFDTTLYNNLTDSDKNEAKGFANSYSSSNSKSIKKVAKEKKIEAQQKQYYFEPEYYTKSNISSVLPTTLADLRGTSAKELISHLTKTNNLFTSVEGNFLINRSTATSPVYLDSSSGYYYVCEVGDYYGYYANENVLDTTSKYKSVVNYQIEAYQSGEYMTYKYDADSKSYVDDVAVKYSESPDKFESVIKLVQTAAENIYTEAIKKEAIVDLFNKYNLETNDQDVHDYIKSSYPDYFASEEE